MKITINNRRKIFSIQEKFNQLFPSLKIEFFAKPSKEGGPASKKIVEKSSRTIGDCRTEHRDGVLTITPNMTVEELESTLRNVYGLKAHIYRKAGKSWIETSITNGWTLEKQNHQGEILSEEIS